MPSEPHFDVEEVEVRGGLVGPARLPRGAFFRWENPAQGRELIVFIAEAQPAAAAYAYAKELLETAVQFGVERVVTFASMGSGLHPAGAPKVFGVATDADILAELQRVEVHPLSDGQIGGLNGVLLGVAASTGVPGMCLLAEIPFFAANVPNPKAARAALSVFSVLAGVDIDLQELGKHAAAMERALVEAVEKLQKQREGGTATGAEEESAEEEIRTDSAEESEQMKTMHGNGGSSLDFATRERVERLFQEARTDKSKAMALKQELDRLRVFEKYEDRFLDLFRRAE